jgi:hypothetical protein
MLYSTFSFLGELKPHKKCFDMTSIFSLYMYIRGNYYSASNEVNVRFNLNLRQLIATSIISQYKFTERRT